MTEREEIEKLYIALRKISDLAPGLITGGDGKWGEVAMSMGIIADEALALEAIIDGSGVEQGDKTTDR